MNFYQLKSFVKKIKMKTFKDLDFETFDNPIMSGVKCRINFDNGFGASVVSHTHSYGGKEGLYELAVLFENELHYDNTIANGDVIGYLKEDDVTELLIQIQKL